MEQPLDRQGGSGPLDGADRQRSSFQLVRKAYSLSDIASVAAHEPTEEQRIIGSLRRKSVEIGGVYGLSTTGSERPLGRQLVQDAGHSASELDPLIGPSTNPRRGASEGQTSPSDNTSD